MQFCHKQNILFWKWKFSWPPFWVLKKKYVFEEFFLDLWNLDLKAFWVQILQKNFFCTYHSFYSNVLFLSQSGSVAELWCLLLLTWYISVPAIMGFRLGRRKIFSLILLRIIFTGNEAQSLRVKTPCINVIKRMVLIPLLTVCLQSHLSFKRSSGSH